MWDIISQLPWPRRFALYTAWKDNIYASHPLVTFARARASAAAKAACKRIAKETIKNSARLFAKVACSNPLPLFEILFSQLEVFNNLM